MNATDVMTRDVLTVAPTTPIAEAIRVMLEKHVSGLPVIDAAGSLVGILTEGDLLRRAETGTEKHRPRWLQFLRGDAALASDYVRTHGRRVGEVMTPEVVSVTESAGLEDVVSLMERHHIKRVPVICATRLVGVISRSDLLRALLECLPNGDGPAADDDTLRDHVIAELKGQAWSEDGRITVTATNGAVQLDGVIFDPRERDAMRVAAENVPGVKQVIDRLVFVDPNIGLVAVP
jgi:CBS domain-containing protein